MRPAAVALTVLVAPLLMAAVSSERTAVEVEAQGWRKMAWNGIRPAQFTATPSGGIRVQGQGEGAFITRPLTGAATCLAWRWRVDAGPPPTDLTRRGGDDRALNIAIGFAEFGPGTGAMTRTQHAIAQASAGGHRLPRSILSYVWGGTGQEAQGGFFTSPWTAGITRMKVLRPATWAVAGRNGGPRRRLACQLRGRQRAGGAGTGHLHRYGRHRQPGGCAGGEYPAGALPLNDAITASQLGAGNPSSGARADRPET